MCISPLGDTFGQRLAAYLTSPQDFRKYRQRLSRELLRLRHELGLVTRDTKNYQDHEKTSSVSADMYNGNEKYAKILLLLAERNLVHFLEIKSILEMKGQLIPGYKKLMAGKLKLAVMQCRRLVSVVSEEPEALRKLEFYVYAALVNGQYAVHKKQWAFARHVFSLARLGLEFLSAQSDESDDQLFGKALVSEILDMLVDPSLVLAHSQDLSRHKTTAGLRTIARKYCCQGEASLLQPIVKIISQKDASFVAEIAEEYVPKTVAWRAHEATIYNDEMALELSKISHEDWRLYTNANDYDSLFAKWAALVEMHENDVEKGKDDDDMEKTQDNAILMTYLKYHMLFVKVKRDLLLIGQLYAHQVSGTCRLLTLYKDSLRLYSSVVGTADELKDLPGVYNDEELYKSLEDMLRFFTVLRSSVVADAYALAHKIPEALRIYVHIQLTFSGAENYYKVDGFPYEVSNNVQVEEHRKNIVEKTAKIHTLAQLHHESESVVPATVAENIYVFPASLDSLQNITNVGQRSALLPVLSKPVLFDVAFNYIGYSSEKCEQKASKQSSGGHTERVSQTGDKKNSSFFGIFGRS